MNLQELIKAIEQWAEDRNIIKGSKPIDQAMKLFSEAGELSDNIGKGKDIKDDVGDVFVVLTVISKQLGEPLGQLNFDSLKWAEGENKQLVSQLFTALSEFVMSSTFDHWSVGLVRRSINILSAIAANHGTTLEECVAIAYNDIKDRHGYMKNGIFIKLSDMTSDDRNEYEKSINDRS